VGLFHNISGGVQDFFYEPFKGLARGPGDFARGLEKGTVSLVTSSVGGLLEATNDVTESISKGLASATLDPVFQAKRRARRRETCRNAFDGVISGVTSVGMGFSGAVTGVFTMPAEGRRKRGTKGFFSGIGKGLVGLVTKPLAGTVEGMTQVIEGVEHQIWHGDSHDVKQVRLPRALGVNNAVVPYSPKAAFGIGLIRKLAEKHTEVSLSSSPSSSSFLMSFLWCPPE